MKEPCKDHIAPQVRTCYGLPLFGLLIGKAAPYA